LIAPQPPRSPRDGSTGRSRSRGLLLGNSQTLILTGLWPVSFLSVFVGFNHCCAEDAAGGAVLANHLQQDCAANAGVGREHRGWQFQTDGVAVPHAHGLNLAHAVLVGNLVAGVLTLLDVDGGGLIEIDDDNAGLALAIIDMSTVVA